MQKQRLKIMLKSGVALLILVVWSATARAQPTPTPTPWTPLASTPRVVLDTCLLLTDGTVMCHQTNSNRWHRLTPNINGSYQNGAWDSPPISPMPNGNDASFLCTNCTYAPRYFASQVLADGRVVVVGGEYNTPGGQVWTNIGFMYDPVTDPPDGTCPGCGSWSAQLTVPIPGNNLGNAQSTILPNRRLLIAGVLGPSSFNIASFDPATLTFTLINPTGKADGNDEENWNILPDGTVLTVDSTIASQFEILTTGPTNNWTRGPTRVNLADWGAGTVNSAEVGPAVLRPDGTLIAFSGTNSGLNAIYDTNTGTWAPAPATANFPVGPGASHFSVADGPASLLPNGNVLVMASPVYPTKPPGVFNAPSHFFEFDGTNLTKVADGDKTHAASLASFQGRFLLLPTGEVLFTSEPNTDVSLYSNGGLPQDAWRPVITTAPSQVVAGNTYSISGTLFNGFSEGASYGDNAQMSTNYPLVRIENHATNPPHVFYARTYDHSRMGVEPVGSNAIVTTQFDAPPGLEPGPSNLVVVVNGIASVPIPINRTADLSVTKTDSPDPVTVGNNLTYTVTVTNNGPDTATSVTVTDDLPAETTFFSCFSTGGGVCSGSGNNSTVTFASLTSGESETITFVASVNCSVADGTVISNTATVSAFTFDPNLNNNSATATTTASNPPPTITGVSANPSVLWPPNHRLVDVTVDYNVTDNCPLPPNSCTLSVTSNEPINGTGDGNTTPDWIILDDHHVLLRAERAGNGNGRIYTVTITCTDSGGNSSSKSVTVSVPHDRGRR
jgi:uncharacterized repeat protein (TIGR01451 family)